MVFRCDWNSQAYWKMDWTPREQLGSLRYRCILKDTQLQNNAKNTNQHIPETVYVWYAYLHQHTVPLVGHVESPKRTYQSAPSTGSSRLGVMHHPRGIPKESTWGWFIIGFTFIISSSYNTVDIFGFGSKKQEVSVEKPPTRKGYAKSRPLIGCSGGSMRGSQRHVTRNSRCSSAWLNKRPPRTGGLDPVKDPESTALGWFAIFCNSYNWRIDRTYINETICV